MESRDQLQKRLFPAGIPKLWCPALTHFHAARQPDERRIAAHHQSISPYVKGLLIPGSTGEGWQMSDSEIETVLSIVLPIAQSLQMKVLIGILKTTTEDVLKACQNLTRYLTHPACVGITVCPAKEKSLSQAEISQGLAQILRLEIPTALYQLPQVTENEMSADTICELASGFPNFYLFKDTSGEDRVAKAKRDLAGVFLVRGSELGYAEWYKPNNGLYDGFLLSTANIFARQLHDIITLCDQKHFAKATELSARQREIVSRIFAVASKCTEGNAFTNANKLADYFAEYQGKKSTNQPPMLITGTTLPVELLNEVKLILDEYDLN